MAIETCAVCKTQFDDEVETDPELANAVEDFHRVFGEAGDDHLVWVCDSCANAIFGDGSGLAEMITRATGQDLQ